MAMTPEQAEALIDQAVSEARQTPTQERSQLAVRGPLPKETP